MAENFEEYQDLSGTGYQGGGSGEKVAPEDEFFHSVYVAGKTRKNHLGLEEKSGKLQVRGVEYNLDEVNLVITHTKDILAKIKSEKKGETIECFSFKEGEAPWHGTTKLSNGSPRPCPTTSAERASNDFCNPCRAQILVAGIYCKPDGAPILTEEKKPVFVFIRGKGMRYSNVSNYLNDLYNEEELDPVFEPVTDQSKAFEKSVVNNKRFVTRITRDTEESSFGSTVNIFNLERGPEIPKSAVIKILKLSKETVDQFNEKFDWSKRKQGAVSGYGDGDQQQATEPPEGIMSMDDESPKESDAAPTEDKPEESKTFSFDDIQF
jgi:hypothetical protein